ncbi:valyl-tRNA synthetase isoform X2 [Oratosquilla oratoria]|uniref:valyl-tRNA synthetase isoform X2 n=1 Tax=Oratosquilla oratoria TaxID=337810 RepID=UPI003F75B1EB
MADDKQIPPLPNEVGDKPKTAKQLEKEAKKAAKLKKFQEKQAKQSPAAPAESVKCKEKKEEKQVVTYDIATPKGEKKDTRVELPAAYSPRYVEAAWNDWWKKEGFFKPEYMEKNHSGPGPREKFIMVIPPPNVTGSLHLGHALTNSVEDAICRWHRMKGHAALWVPGCDHAGIATQVVVEKKLKREEGKSRHDLGRDAFIKRVWDWKNEKGDRIYQQLESLGSSLDWDRATFTMDPGPQNAVKECFVQLHEDGTIYRSNRLVNWSCTLKSAISDIEVEKKELAGRTELPVPGYKEKVEFGVLVSFRYQVEDSDDYVVVATTRIETMLGDTAVAVHPKDERYKHLHGKMLIHPFADRKLPVVTDEIAVDMTFGTGAVKITPAHDPNDYEVGKRHKLEFITIFTDDGVIKEGYHPFSGMKRFEARKAVLEALKKKGMYVETKDNPMVVPVCSRSKDIVEPMLKPQWYVSCSDMAAKAIEAVKSGELELIPKMHERTWFHWMGEIRDWCISRQLWWGHQIPAYFVTINDPAFSPGKDDDEKYWVSGRSEEEALEKAVKKFNVPKEKITLRQDPDVLDTWFSSALFPFSVLGWPNETSDMKKYYPTSLLETGHDILFFWVARMVFFSQKLLGKLPFKQVYLHAMVRDSHGRKMSKSLGNVIDPMDVVYGITLEDLHKQLEENSNLESKEIAKAKEGQKQDYPSGIPECGTDALRFALCAYTAQGRDINLDVLRVKGYRNFCNKLWNATKFAMMNLGKDFKPYSSLKVLQDKVNQLSTMDCWMLSMLARAVQECNTAFQDFNFPQATTALYNLWWYQICDVYLECLKPVMYSGSEEAKELSRNVLYTCLYTGLCLISPFMPFLSEELFQRLPKRTSDEPPSICVTRYPEPEDYNIFINENIEEEVKFSNKVIGEVRSAKAMFNIPNKTKIELTLQSEIKDTCDVLEKLSQDIATLTLSTSIKVGNEKPKGSVPVPVSSDCVAWIKLQGLVDLQVCQKRIQEKKESSEKALGKLKDDMGKPHYYEKVPESIRQKNCERAEELQGEIEKNADALKQLGTMEIE